MQNYSLLKEFNLQVIGEIKLRIMMHLMALPGQKIENITKVISHYMALLQCSEFLKQYPNMIEEKTHDTADSAKLIKESSLKGVAAIASHRAAKVYGLEVLASEIETIKQNFTRFLVLQKRKDTSIIDNINKAMLSFELPNTIGSLARTLKLIVDYQINLTKIQSVPLIGKPDQYTFYVDCEFEDFKAYKDCIEKVTNRFELVMVAAQRARKIGSGGALTIDRDNDKNPVVALREIAEETVVVEELKEDLIRNNQRVIALDDDGEDVIDMMEGEQEWGAMSDQDRADQPAEEPTLTDMAGAPEAPAAPSEGGVDAEGNPQY